MNGSSAMEITGNSSISAKLNPLPLEPNETAIYKAFAGKPTIFKGIDAAYIQINEYWGFKYTDSPYMTDILCWRNHQVLEKCGLAPQLGCCVMRFSFLPNCNLDRIFGFAIEHCRTPHFEEGYCPLHQKRFKDLCEVLDKLFGHSTITFDLDVTRNVGYNHAGVLVPYDFSYFPGLDDEND